MARETKEERAKKNKEYLQGKGAKVEAQATANKKTIDKHFRL